MRELQLGIMFSIANASKNRVALSASDVTPEAFGLEVMLAPPLNFRGVLLSLYTVSRNQPAVESDPLGFIHLLSSVEPDSVVRLICGYTASCRDGTGKAHQGSLMSLYNQVMSSSIALAHLLPFAFAAWLVCCCE